MFDVVQNVPSWLIVATSCCTTLALSAAAGIGVALYDPGPTPTSVENPFAESRPSAAPVFPDWIEVPHLSDPLPADAGGRAQTIGRSVPVASTTVDLSVLRSALKPPDADAPADGARQPRPRAPAGLAPVEAVLVAPDLARTQPPGATQRARSPRPPPVIRVFRPAEPDRDAERTASVVAMPKPPLARIDTGTAVRASVRRPRPDPQSPSRAPAAASPPWTLPPALAPTP